MQQKKSYYGFALTIFLIIILYFWVNPLRHSVNDLRAERDALNTKIETVTGATNIEKSNVAVTNLDKEMLTQAIPQGFDQDILIKLINSIANENLVHINNIGFSKTIADISTQIQSVQLSISGSANYADFEGFLSSLENNNRGFIIKNINTSYATNEGVKKTNFTLNFEGYFS